MRYKGALPSCPLGGDTEGLARFYFAHFFIGRVHEQRHEFSEAIAELQAAIQLDESPDAVGLFGHTYAASGNKEEAIKILDELMEMSKRRDVKPYKIAVIYAGLDDKGRAFEWLRKLTTSGLVGPLGLKSSRNLITFVRSHSLQN